MNGTKTEERLDDPSLPGRAALPALSGRTAVVGQPGGVKPVGVDKSADRVRRMFAEIAPRYDFLNHFLSLNIDRHWRSRSLRILDPKPGEPFLDVCTGTGDLALAASKRLRENTEVVGSDFCGEMLQFARKKQQKYGFDKHSLVFLEADTMRLPFPDDRFQTVTVAFGLRNVADTQVGLAEMMRVCKKGGTVAVLEFSQPTLPGLKQLYQFYFKRILPGIGNRLAKNSKDAYAYLPASVSQFPSGEAMAEMMRSSGLQQVRFVPMTFGVVTLYMGRK